MWKIQLTIKIHEDLIIKFPLVLLILEFELNFASKIKMGMWNDDSFKKVEALAVFSIISCFIGACGMKKEESSKDKQIKENFNKTLSLYPTKNLEDFYDKEGFRDEEFEKGDKGTWIIHSKMTIETNGKNMESEAWSCM